MKRGPKCTVCRHEDRHRLELLRAGGASIDALAKKFKLGRDAIARHWKAHVTAEAKASYLAGPVQIAELHATAAAESVSVIDYYKAVRTMLMAQLAATSGAGDARGAAAVAGQLISVLEKIGRITGEISALAAAGSVSVTNNIAILNSPEWARLQAKLLRALAPFEPARLAVVEMLMADTAAAEVDMKVIEHAA